MPCMPQTALPPWLIFPSQANAWRFRPQDGYVCRSGQAARDDPQGCRALRRDRYFGVALQHI